MSRENYADYDAAYDADAYAVVYYAVVYYAAYDRAVIADENLRTKLLEQFLEKLVPLSTKKQIDVLVKALAQF